MIYTRVYGEVKIIGQCGKHQPAYLGYALNLARVEIYFPDEGKTIVRHQFLNFLKADDGWKEICDAYNAAPMIELTDAELEKAFKEAE